MSYCCATQRELQGLGLIRRKNWTVSGLASAEECVARVDLSLSRYKLSSSALFSFEPLSSTTVGQTEFVYKLSQAHCCSPLNSSRKCIGVVQIWCSSPSFRLMWLREGKNTRHKAGTQTQNSNSSFQGVATSLILTFKKQTNRFSSILADTIWAVWLYLVDKPTSCDWYQKFLLNSSLFWHRIPA